MTFKKILGLACLVGIMALFIFKVELPKQEQEKLSKLFLAGIPRDKVNRIEVKRSSDSFSIIKDKSLKVDDLDQWKLHDLKSAKLDEGAVMGLVSGVEEFELGSPISLKELNNDLAPFGLDKPPVELTVGWDGGQKKVQFGKKSDYLGERYVRLPESGKVYLVSEGLFAAANKSVFDLRDHTPIDLDTEKINSFDIKSNEKNQQLLKDKSGEWILKTSHEAPVAFRADQSAILELIRKINALEVSGYVDEVDGEYPAKLEKINNPDAELIFRVVADQDKQDERSLRLSVIDEADGPVTYFKQGSSPTLNKVKGSVLGDFALVDLQLVNKKVLEFDINKVQKVLITFNDQSYELIKETDPKTQAIKWTLDGTGLDPVAVDSYLKTLQAVEAVSVKESTERELAGILEFKFKQDGSSSETALKVGPSEVSPDGKDSLHTLIRSDWGGVYQISEQSFNNLIPKVDALKTLGNSQTSTSSTAVNDSHDHDHHHGHNH